MAITINNALKDKMLDCVFNGGSGVSIFNNATLTIRTGSPPGAGSAASGTVLATVTLPADAMAAASGGSIAKSGTWQDTSADATGTAAHFRVTDATYIVEGTVATSAADMIVDSVSFTATQSFTINTCTFSL